MISSFSELYLDKAFTTDDKYFLFCFLPLAMGPIFARVLFSE